MLYFIVRYESLRHPNQIGISESLIRQGKGGGRMSHFQNPHRATYRQLEDFCSQELALSFLTAWPVQRSLKSQIDRFTNSQRTLSFIWLCITVFDYVWLCKTMYDYVWLWMTMYDYVLLCIPIYEYLSLCMTMHGYLWLCMTLYDYVSLFFLIFSSL